MVTSEDLPELPAGREPSAGRDALRTRRFQERQLRSIIEQLADGIVIVSAEGVIRFANPAAETLFARSARQLVGTQFGFPITSGAPAEIDVLRSGAEPVTAELRVVDVMWEGEPACLVSIRDVTDRRRADERARQVERERIARIEAEAANHAKSEFLATMSHELRTPLNAVIGYAQLLELGIGGGLPVGHQQHVERILASSRHLLGLVSEVLDLAKVDAGRLAVHDGVASAGGTADAAAALVQPSAEARAIALNIQDGAESDVWYEGDEDRVRQILINLLTNAVKFTEAGGEVSLAYGQTTEPEPAAQLPPNVAWTYFRVSDTGIGIPEEQISRVFEPFVQVKSGRTRSNDGSGLGLAISRRLARLMGGEVTVRSRMGDGSVFTVWLRAARPEGRSPVEERVTSASTVVRLQSLSDVGEILLHELASLLATFVTRVRAECPAPGVEGLRFSQIADHVAAYLADLAGVLIALEDAAGQPSSVLADATEIHRLVAGRHGTQRARLGWTADAIRYEYHVLREEIERTLHRQGTSISAQALDEGIVVIGRLLDQAQQTSLRAFARVTTGASRS